MRCCAGDEGVALRRRPAGVASNHLMLRWLMTVVVSDEKKAHAQVGIGKASVSEPLRKRRNNQDDIRAGEFKSLRDEPRGCPLVWPGGVRRIGGASPICSSCCSSRAAARQAVSASPAIAARNAWPTAASMATPPTAGAADSCRR